MINKREELKKVLNHKHGILIDSDLEVLEEIFGDEFIIVAKMFGYNWEYFSIRDYRKFIIKNCEDIEEITIDPVTFAELCEEANVNSN